MKPNGKRKAQNEDSNLKRFKTSINKFTEAQSEDVDTHDPRYQTKKAKMTRKEQRKEIRQLVGMRKNAFKQRKPVSFL